MHASYSDITDRLGKPLWWDEAGAPRYALFHPSYANNIYAKEAVLLLVRCQSCHSKFPVCLTWDGMEELILNRPRHSLAERVQAKALHYGDPPDAGCCPSGPTMTSETLQVLEFWRRKDLEWVRVEELEVTIDDNAKSSSSPSPNLHTQQGKETEDESA